MATGTALTGRDTARNGRPRRAPTSHAGRTRRKAVWILAPSMILISVFVYVFLGITVYISLSNWRISTNPDLSIRHPLGATYAELFGEGRFQADLRNVVVFTVLFLVAAVGLGFLAALLVHHVVVAKGFFRTVILLPYALSFIVTGVIWRWIMAPSTGINVILKHLGIHNPPGWTTDTTILGALNHPGNTLQIALGIPVAILPLVFAAAWQLLGFAMAMYLAGLASIPEEIEEAASVDGANVWQRLRLVTMPQLWPSTVTCLVILLHVALKIFDLVVAMAGPGAGFVTDVPGLYIYNYLTSRYDKASAAGIVLLVMTLVVIVPYLARSYRRERRGA